MKLTRVHSAVIGALGGVCALTLQTAAFAQDQSQGALEEIVVTATRRAEDLQQVPISIVAVTGEGLQTRGIQNVEGLNATIPNLNVMGSAGGSGTSQVSYRVRGIPNVSTYVDGVWQISTQGSLTQDFVDLDRVEVLRGPQGTLFGRDAEGGAIRIFTKRPSDEFGAMFKGTVGTFNRHDAAISADLPFSDKVKSKWTFADSNRDGYITSLTTGKKGGNIDEQNVRGDIVWTPTDKLDIRAQASRLDSSFFEPRVQDAVWDHAILFPTTAQLLYTNAGLPYDQNSQMAGWPGGTVGKWENRSEITIPNHIVTDQTSVDIKWALSDRISLDFLTAYTNQDLKVFVDYDNSQYGLVEDTVNQRQKFTSEEIQLSGGGDRITWVAGIFYWDENQLSRNVRYSMEEFNVDPIGRADNALALALYQTPYCQALAVNPPPGPSSTCQTSMAFYKGFASNQRGNGGSLTETGTSGTALFGEVNFNLTDKLTLTVGARSHNQDNHQQVYTPLNQAPQFTNQDYGSDPLAGTKSGAPTGYSFDKNSGRVSARYQFTKDIMAYLSFAQGFNSGNGRFLTLPGTSTPVLYTYKPESLDNTEIGIRSDLANGHIRFNATYFDSKWDDIQVALALRYCDANNNCYDLPGLQTQNVGGATAKGTELEMIWAPTDKFLVNVNLGFLSTALTSKDPATVTPAANVFVVGNTEFSQAPKRTQNIGFQYDASLKKGGTFTTRLDYTYVSQYWRNFDPSLRVAYNPSVPAGFSDEAGNIGKFNMRLTYAPADGKWDLSVFGTNLTDEYDLNSGFFHGLWGYDFATVGRPRELGTSITFHF
jgi:iron complex outermembrane recepter protein